MSPKKKLRQIAAFWRNDQPDGLGLRFDDEQLLSVVAPEIDKYLREGSADISSDEMLDQLVALGRTKASGLAFEEQIVAILNIAALEHRGVIPTNEFNGISYVFAEEATSEAGDCFIATVCYGSPCSPEVLELRRFRDEVLLRSRIGTIFVSLYWRVSPALANYIRRRPRLRIFIKQYGIAPLVRLITTRR